MPVKRPPPNPSSLFLHLYKGELACISESLFVLLVQLLHPLLILLQSSCKYMIELEPPCVLDTSV